MRRRKWWLQSGQTPRLRRRRLWYTNAAQDGQRNHSAEAARLAVASSAKEVFRGETAIVGVHPPVL